MCTSSFTTGLLRRRHDDRRRRAHADACAATCAAFAVQIGTRAARSRAKADGGLTANVAAAQADDAALRKTGGPDLGLQLPRLFGAPKIKRMGRAGFDTGRAEGAFPPAWVEDGMPAIALD
jgi:hypothetical protein